MQVFTEQARAKVNLTLRVRGRRADGYHELDSLVAFADVGDTVSLTLGPERVVTVTGPFAAGIAGPNLLDRCLAFAGMATAPLQLGAVRLEKQLPVAAGLGGGSADTAALLRAIRRANDRPDAAAVDDWLRLAAQLGADVPVCLENRASFISGIGETVVPIANLPKLPAVLVNPCVPVPSDKTAQVFQRLGAKPLPAGARLPEPPPLFERSPQLVAYMEAHDNDLGPAARLVVPAIADVEHSLSATAGCLLVRISGAGPTCFGVYGTGEAAAAAATALGEAHPHWWIRNVTLG